MNAGGFWTGHSAWKQKGEWADGVVTVFFTLLAALFIGFFFALTESARVEGCRAQAVCLTDMADFSVFGEYERKVLKDFDIFALDGGQGSGTFDQKKVDQRLKHFLEINENPAAEGIASLCFDPWQLKLEDAKLTGYALLTDNGCENFYQQAVGYMRETAWMGAAAQLLTFYTQAQELSKKQEAYEADREESDRQLEEAEKQQAQAEAEQKSTKPDDGLQLPEAVQPAKEEVDNPFPVFRRLRNMDIFDLACPGMEISEKRVFSKEFASQRAKKKGTMAAAAPYGGLTNDLLFKEYLMGRFGCLTAPGKAKLSYELEYLLAGKHGDRNNLRSVLKNLLAFRESVNYLYVSGDVAMSSQADTVSTVLIGWLGMPGLTALVKHALLLGWAYCESVSDLRILTAGGKVPLQKDAGSWKVSAEVLTKLDTWLSDKGPGKGKGEGLDYKEHLRLLLYLTPVDRLKKRGMDMLELCIRSDEKLDGFRVDHCLAAMKAETSWSIPAHYSRVTKIFLRAGAKEAQVKVSGGYAYVADEK